MTEFSGKTALVTGAGSGIGRAIALELARCGAKVHLVGRSISTLERVAAAACASGPRAFCHHVDLAQDDQIDDLVMHLHRDMVQMDVLVHSAGVITLGKVEDVSREQFDYQLRVNLRAPLLLTQGLLPLVRKGQGQIVFINSSVIGNSRAMTGPYAATKYALKAIADSLRAEVNVEGLRVVSVYPGRTASPMQSRLHEAEAKEYHPERLLQPSSVARTVVSSLRLPRDAEVTDINIRPLQSP